jgi:hypothetical protein
MTRTQHTEIVDHTELFLANKITKAATPEEFAEIVEAMAEEEPEKIAAAFSYDAPYSGYETLYFFQLKTGEYYTSVESDGIMTDNIEDLIAFLKRYNTPTADAIASFKATLTAVNWEMERCDHSALQFWTDIQTALHRQIDYLEQVA